MKFFVYLTSLILTLALMGLFVLKKPNGQAWLVVDDLFPKTLMIDQEIKSIADKLLVTYENFIVEENNQIEQGSDIKIYRWKDNSGNWSYSDKPKASVESEEVYLDPNDVVVLPAFKVSTNNSPNAKPLKIDIMSSQNPLTTSPNNMLNLFKDANNVQKLIDDREENISKAIKDRTR